MGIILKDWYGKDKVYDYDQLWVRDTEGGLVPFTKGLKPTLETLEVTENGTYNATNVTGYDKVIVDVEPEVNEVLLNKTDFAGFATNEELDGLYTKTVEFGTDVETFKLIVGREYTVYWDDVTYNLDAKDTYRIFEEVDNGETLYREMYYLGNGALLGYDDLADTGEPFAILYTASKGLTLITTDAEETHNLALIKRVRPRDGLDMMLQNITVEENGEYVADPYYDGLKKVVVNIDPTKVFVMKETTLSKSTLDDTFGYVVSINPTPFTLTLDETYFVKWDGITYECTAYNGDAAIPGTIYLGNATPLGLPGNGEPFIIAITPDNGGICNFICGTDTEPTAHKVSIWQKVSGGSSADVRYVTFMSWDGTEEHGKKAVATGDDCADPISRGIFDTPTRESDVQYNYKHGGWSDEPNGTANANWNKAVTEDKTVYAYYTKSTRQYTITYYDEDGITVLKTESKYYGTTPSYIPDHPTDDKLMFDCWTPEITPVTGNASYVVSWKAKPSFETSSWSEIADVCNADLAPSTFSVGDKKPITLTYSDGTSETINFTIVDMNADVKAADGSATAALTLMADNVLKTSLVPASKYNGDKVVFYDMDNAKAFMEEIFNALPSDLREVITPVYKKKTVLGTTHEVLRNIFLPSYLNLVGTEWKYNTASSNYAGSYVNYLSPTKQYAYFKNGATIKRTKLGDTTADDYWTATLHSATSTSYYTCSYVVIDGTTGAAKGGHADAFGIVPCFCIG